jgi:prepilin-type N-terminal cleavage/methylation domain-containing protein
MRRPQGFTLIELLIVIAIIAILAVMIIANWDKMKNYSQRTATLSNMRQIGVGFYCYAGENDARLPRRVTDTNTSDKWPKLLAEYLDDIRVYAAVGDRSNYIFQKTDPLSDARNNTSYIMNGYNDLGAFTNEAVEIRLTRLERPASVILLGTPKSGSTHFYMDMLEGPNGNHLDVLNLELYSGGSCYLFADGSARFIKKVDYDPHLWLVDTNFPIP